MPKVQKPTKEEGEWKYPFMGTRSFIALMVLAFLALIGLNLFPENSIANFIAVCCAVAFILYYFINRLIRFW